MEGNTNLKQLRDLKGMRFGRWTVLERSHREGSKKTYWKCRCDCGTVRDVNAVNLVNGESKSCGCFQREQARELANTYLHKPTHGDCGKRLYAIYGSMKSRCYNKNHVHYKHYGGKGITICEAWKSNYKIFKEWALKNGYSDGMSIDRIDNSLGYFPENCRWIPLREQSKNRTINHFVIVNGEKMTISDCSRKYNIPLSTVRYLIAHKRDIFEYVPRAKKNKDTRHQCRWCCGLSVKEDAIYCTTLEKKKTESHSKHVNRCPYFEFSGVDAYDPSHKYKRRTPMKQATTG